MEMCNCNHGDCFCQSCGMPMKEEKDFGTEVGGGKNCENCTYCYQEGKYTVEASNPEEFIMKVKAKMGEMGMPVEEIEQSCAMMAPVLPSLKRWQ